jgi:hypothetical protein
MRAHARIRNDRGPYWLLDNFDDATLARFNQHRRLVHHRIAIVAHAIFRRNIVIGDAGFRQHDIGAQRLRIAIGMRAVLADCVVAETRAVWSVEAADSCARRSACRATGPPTAPPTAAPPAAPARGRLQGDCAKANPGARQGRERLLRR